MEYKQYQSIIINGTTNLITYDAKNKRLWFDEKKTYRVACEGYALKYALPLTLLDYGLSPRGASILTLDQPQDAFGNVAENPNSIIKTNTIIGNNAKHSQISLAGNVYASDCSGDNAGIEISGALLATTPEFIFRIRQPSTSGTLPLTPSGTIGSFTATIGFHMLD